MSFDVAFARELEQVIAGFDPSHEPVGLFDLLDDVPEPEDDMLDAVLLAQERIVAVFDVLAGFGLQLPEEAKEALALLAMAFDALEQASYVIGDALDEAGS